MLRQLGDDVVEFNLKSVKDCGSYCGGWSWTVGNDPLSLVQPGNDPASLDRPGPLFFKIVDESHLRPQSSMPPVGFTFYSGSSDLVKK